MCGRYSVVAYLKAGSKVRFCSRANGKQSMEQKVESAGVAESLPAKIKMTGIVQNPQPRPARNLLANIKCLNFRFGGAGIRLANAKSIVLMLMDRAAYSMFLRGLTPCPQPRSNRSKGVKDF
jgi:hypothetical protein